ncbi:MAG: exodeoxyribonuclease VII small subunit [Candidatus Edwardsbacteria bacterium RIFOXYD12_FULL_50_11]|uniref:Exodeoxyribonuclease 7 small subunit n=1 Tax=Candidatus Edwardsbacteria bacterium GWF2_54_11 TaxID=1817851 RepID=A0A1F5R321_9BACT|nr:MAG: exodeoxyribonuclease VII small subunit [Candidatus Edwardsbacteria bacterium RifOxyC12_full_54_24]OGF06738.1 MAG: exodeoxyribonuclease VII small subunit [Candidatus Edwardsbacteria bacterium RifOxyA12_full_54_48]OGF08806.1 MAG: exodeoxyribonuclease VII small subunit [Candidatus Edwardsbacteria bacterium GWF2_54_11]OGF10689.1 MAG: exodeoxyribonuclease VII small subunit [Candidatus Edwardsbacteria bacterium GWE2_54_12]OGF15470.1 MAG: exodeoxyribonuclease VII small subunit [Candidatus Edwa
MKKAKTDADFKFEKALARIEQIVDQMESGEIELDQALTLYQEGMELMARCQATLEETQNKIKKITRDIQGRLKVEEHHMEEN